MKKIILPLVMGSLFSVAQVNAQVSAGGKPASMGVNGQVIAGQYVPMVETAMPDITRLEQDSKSVKSVGLKSAIIGVTVNTDIGYNLGTTTDMPDGSKVWRLQISMQGAPALGLYYDAFSLPQGVSYFLYNANGKQVLGAYTSENNPGGGAWATEKVQGSIINLEMDIEPGVNTDDIILHINKVAVFNRGIAYLQQFSPLNAAQRTTSGPYYPFNGSSDCEVNAICPIGTNYPDQRKATITFEYVFGPYVAAASATVINNTRQDCTPYILTATHTEASNSTSDATFAQWLFYFNYETPTCTYTGAQPVPQTMTGATFVSRASYDSASQAIAGDFLLLKLKQNIPASYGAYFAGWNLNTTATTGTFIGFHHPSGDVKKVSITSTIDSTGNVNNGGQNTHWQLQWSQGGVEEGSSGSGLYNAQGQLIGIASVAGAITPPCTDTNFVGLEMFDYAEYSKISYDWLYTHQVPSTPQSRLKDWLDPDNTGLTSIDAIPASCNNTGVSQQRKTSNDFSIFPNPTKGITYAYINMANPGYLKIQVFDVIGNKVSEQVMTNAATGNYKIDMSNSPNGIYLVSVSTNKGSVTKKVIVNK